MEAGQAAGFNVELLTVEVGSRDLVDTTQLSELGTELGVSVHYQENTPRVIQK